MMNDLQYRRLMRLRQTEKTKAIASSRIGVDEKTARRYMKVGKMPSEMKKEHDWNTRKDPFEDDWTAIKKLLSINPGLEAITIFRWLQRNNPGKYQDGQLRTLQRKVKNWRCTEGPGQEVIFEQVHQPGRLCESDFTEMDKLNVTINGELFSHILYHFVLTYSNWETGSICYSESFESLNEGFQKALWELGAVPEFHRTDRMSTAVNNLDEEKTFTKRYEELLKHYDIKGEKTNANSPNENGDIEQRHYRIKDVIAQSLMLRGSRDFSSIGEYEEFLKKMFMELNAGRREKLCEEMKVMKELPKNRCDICTKVDVRVSRGSLIRIRNRVYSVNSRLIGETVRVHIYAGHVEVWYGQKQVEQIPRLKGKTTHYVQYRHIIDSLIRKPGAFKNYRYMEDLFPTVRFRMVYDELCRVSGNRGVKEYLRILHLAAHESEMGVDEALRYLFLNKEGISYERVKEIVELKMELKPVTEVNIGEVSLRDYDNLMAAEEGKR